MNQEESEKLLRFGLGRQDVTSSELMALSSRLEHLLLALAQAAAFIEANTIAVTQYIHFLDHSDQQLVNLLSEGFDIIGRDSEAPRTVVETWILSFEQIRQKNHFASDLISLMGYFDRQAIPRAFLVRYGEAQRKTPEDMQLEVAIGIIKAFYFVTEGKNQPLNVHRLVQLAVRKWLLSFARENGYFRQPSTAGSDENLPV